MFTVGLTGGIGSGKTVVSDRLATLGATIIDSDRIAHDITAPGGAAMPAIGQTFGSAYVAADGSLDRAKMRELVFQDPQAKSRLEAITHPLIREASRRAANAAHGTYLVFVSPLLVESGSWRDRVDRVLVVDCNEQTQIERVMRRSGLAREQVLAIMANQASRAERLAVANDVIYNDGKDFVRLSAEIDALHRNYIVLAGN